VTPPYREGDWFAVPLRDNAYGVGLAARVDGKGGVLGYFFGPRRTELPDLSELAALSAGDSVLVRQFGDLSLLKREWPVIRAAARMEPQPLAHACLWSPRGVKRAVVEGRVL
jgi:immunity protein 26 of polymorphic toxin system